MKHVLYFLAFVFLISSSASAQNSATFEVWRDTDLFKLSTNTTDSVTFKLEGSAAVITMEVREAFKTRPTRRLQITIPNFNGIGQYNPSTGATTYWENFTQTESCNCFDHAINDVTITKYDSTKKEIGGTFNWKCQSFSTGSGEQINYRIRNGVFDFGGEGKIALELTPRDSIVIGNLTNDTTITLTITAKKGTDLLADVNIFMNDKTANAAATYPQVGTTNANGVLSYTIDFKKSSPAGNYPITLYGEKVNFRRSDTAKVTVFYGNRYWHYKCAGLEVLEFDAGEGKEWKPETEGSSTVKTTGTITVGGAIKIDGTVRINTTDGEQKVFVDGGRVYIPNVRFAPDDIGDLDLTNVLTGSDFPLPNCDGIISLALEAGSKKLSKKLPGGVELTLEEFKIINRADAKGLSMKGKIEFSMARNGCEEVIDNTEGFDLTDDPRSKIEIGISITNTNGFENLTFAAEKISVTSGWCLEEFSVNADFLNKVYGVAGKLKFPVKSSELTLGAGVVFKNNPANPDNKLHFDSLQASLELGACKLIPETPLCFNGLNFSTSGWSSANANGRAIRASIILQSAEQVVIDQFPWIVNAFGDPTIAEFEGTLEYRHPLIFTGAITSRLIKIKAISESKPWQIEGTHSATIDLNNNVGITGSYKIGHLGLDDYFLSANGNLTYFWKPTLGLSSTVSGLVRLPAAGDDILDMDYIGTAFRFMMLSGFIPQTLGTAQASLLVNEDEGLSVSASVDVTQNPVDYIRSFGRMSVSYKYKNGVPTFTTTNDTIRTWVQPVRNPDLEEDVQDAAQPLDTILVDNTVERLFIMVIGSGTTSAPVSSLTAPDGTVYSTTSADSSVRKFSTPNGEMTQWSLISPAVGSWKLTLTSPKAGDEVEISVNRKPQPFAIALTSLDRTATVTWDGTTGTEEGEVRFFLDTDTTGFNGSFIGVATATSGTFSYTLPSTFTECAYYIHATRIVASQPMGNAYASAAIRLVGTSGVASPLEVLAVSNQFGRTSVQWRMPLGSASDGFLVYVVDESGRDSLYATAFGGERFVMLDIENHINKKIVVVAFNGQGIRGCRTEALPITTGIEEDPFVATGSTNASFSIVPNPTSGHTVIRFNPAGELRSDIEIVNMFGQRVASLPLTTTTTGWNQVEWDAHSAPTGTYYVRLHTSAGIAVAPITVIR